MSGEPTLWGEEPRGGEAASPSSAVRPARTAALLFVDEGSVTTNVALFLTEEGSPRLIGGLSLPRGGSPEAAAAFLRSLAADRASGLLERAALEMHRGGGGDLARAVQHIAEVLQLPIALLDIGAQAGRFVAAAPQSAGIACEVEEAAIAPRDPIERRRRADAVLARIGGADRATIADQLGDLADTPLRDREPSNDRVRAAAVAGAIARLAEMRDEAGIGADLGAPLIVTGTAARLIADGTLPLAALAPLLPVGRSRILIEPLGVLGALGGATLSETLIAALLDGSSGELLLPAGDVLLLPESQSDEESAVEIATSTQRSRLRSGESIRLSLAATEAARVEISRGSERSEAQLFGGITGAEVVIGRSASHVRLSPDAQQGKKARPIPAPIELLPEASGGGDFIAARRLLGDAVSGRVVALESDPDSAGWDAAREAGILAIAKASPETVLRARAVGVRGLIVGSLSDGEIDAIGGSLARRIAAAVATLPFGLLILAGRRSAGDGAVRVIRHLDGAEVSFSAEPPGLVTKGRVARDASDAARDADVVIVGGEHAGRRGHWRGVADPRSDDPLAAIELDGTILALPLGELQRLRT